MATIMLNGSRVAECSTEAGLALSNVSYPLFRVLNSYVAALNKVSFGLFLMTSGSLGC